MKRIFNFLTFQSPTYISVLDEGQRRLIIIASILGPIIMAYLWFYDFEDGYAPSSWLEAIPIFYIIFHLFSLIYIWVREGQGKVRQGGNALKTLLNFVITIFLFCLIGATSGYYYENIYLPQKTTEYQNKKQQDFHNYLSKRYHYCLMNKDWDGLANTLHTTTNNQNKLEFIDFLKIQTQNIEYLNKDEDIIENFSNNNYVVEGIITYTAKKEGNVYTINKKYKFTFADENETTKINKIEYTDVKN